MEDYFNKFFSLFNNVDQFRLFLACISFIVSVLLAFISIFLKNEWINRILGACRINP
jgi:hypothetical protein